MAMVIGKLPIQPNAKAPIKVTKAPIMLIISHHRPFLHPVAVALFATTTNNTNNAQFLRVVIHNLCIFCTSTHYENNYTEIIGFVKSRSQC